MKKFIFENEEKERIKKLYESVGIVLLEDNIFGKIARKALSFAEKNEDDIARLFKTTEAAVVKNIDDIVGTAFKSKSLTPIKELQARLMHIYNPSGLAENIPAAKQKVKNFLNGYAKSKGRTNFQEMKDEVLGNQGQRAQQAAKNTSSNYANTIFGREKIIKKIYESLFDIKKFNINWSVITNKGNSENISNQINHYKNVIYDALISNKFDKISRGGFENAGIANFRTFLQKTNMTFENLLDNVEINWSQIKNKGNGTTEKEWLEYYKKLINHAIEINNFEHIPKEGFESIGVNNFEKLIETLFKK